MGPAARWAVFFAAIAMGYAAGRWVQGNTHDPEITQKTTQIPYVMFETPTRPVALNHQSTRATASSTNGHHMAKTLKSDILVDNSGTVNKHVFFTSFKCGDNVGACSPLRKVIEDTVFNTLSTLKAPFVFANNVDGDVNKFSMPVLKGMFLTAQKRYPNASTFTYINGDIMVTNETLRTIMSVFKHFPRVPFMLTSKRINVPMEVGMTKEIIRIHKQQFQNNAQDIFTVSNGAIDWNTMPNFVIGRRAYDNWLVDYAYHHTNIILIDGSKTSAIYHLTDEKGNYAGHAVKNVVDKEYNVQLLKSGWDHGTTDHASCKTEMNKGYIRVLCTGNDKSIVR